MPSVIDLAFTSPAPAPYIPEWDTILPSIGSDNVSITTIFVHPILAPIPVAPNWVRTDWPPVNLFSNKLPFQHPPTLPTRHSVDRWFNTHLNLLVILLKSRIPLCRLSVMANPWSSSWLSLLKREFHIASHKASTTNNNYDRASAISAKINLSCESRPPRLDASHIVLPSSASPVSGSYSQCRLRPDMMSDLTNIPPPFHISSSSPVPYRTC